MGKVLAGFVIAEVIVLSTIGLINLDLMVELWAKALVGTILVGILVTVAAWFFPKG